MKQSKKYGNLSITVFGRGGGVEHADGIKVQRLDHQLNDQLASVFGQVILVPLVYRYRSPLWANFAQYYKEEVKCNEIRVLPVYNYASFNGTNKFTIRIKAWKNWIGPIFRALRSSNLALIYVPSTLGLIGLTIGFILKKPMIAYIGGEFSIFNPRTGEFSKPIGLRAFFLRLKSTVGKALVERLPVVLTRDYGTYKRLAEHKLGVYYMPGNTAVSRDDLFKRSDTCQSEPIICLTIGSLIPRKGINNIITAIKILRREGYRVKLWHAGGSIPENLAKSISLCRHLDVDEHVVFHGYKNSLDELLSLYRKADIFIMASHSEGYPRSITEAQSQSLPVIATKVGGIPARIENEQDALLINPGKTEEIARAIAKVISDKVLRKRMIANGFILAQQELCGMNAVEVIIKAIDEKFAKVLG